jgi:hypothetical protein
VKTALIVSLTTLTFLSCSAPTEQTLLTQFFAASRLRDLTALHTIATVVFEPAVDGIVTSFDVTRVAATPGSDGHAAAKDVSKNVSISAPVRVPGGQTVLKNFVITIQGGLVTAISERPASPSTPRP